MTIGETLKKTTAELRNKNSQSPQLDAEILLAHIKNKPREYILSHPEEEIASFLLGAYQKLITRRKNNEPVAYLTGHKEFYGLDFIVNKHTLIPRPETELLTEKAVELLQDKLENRKKIAVIDVGTGSGCIITSVAKTIKDLGYLNEDCRFFAIDISKNALFVAKKNAENHGLKKHISFLHGNLLEPLIKNLKSDLSKQDLLILANLPYLSSEIFESSPSSVKNFEPKAALLAGEDGLNAYRELFKQIKELRQDNPRNCELLLEISPEQKNQIEALFNEIFSYTSVKAIKDLSGKWRVIKATIQLKSNE